MFILLPVMFHFQEDLSVHNCTGDVSGRSPFTVLLVMFQEELDSS